MYCICYYRYHREGGGERGERFKDRDSDYYSHRERDRDRDRDSHRYNV